MTIAWRWALLLVTTVSSFRGRDCARRNAKRMMRSTPARVIIETSVATSIGRPWWTRPPTPEYSPSVFSRTITQSRSSGPQRFSGASMPGRMRVGRTLAYWSKPWQIFRRRPHSVTWSGMCGSPAEPNRIASLPRSASRPFAGIISPWARNQSPPQPKSSNSKREGAAGGERFRAPGGRRERLPCRCRRRESSRCGRSSSSAPRAQAATTGIFAMRAFHSAGPVSCTDVPCASTATVTGMSTTSNS